MGEVMTTHQSAKGNRPTFINLGRFLILLCMMAAATSCTSKEDDGSLLVFHGYQEDDVRTFDPADAYDSVSLEMVPMVHETLYEYAYLSDEYKVVPLLAADMPKYSSDRLTVTIPLKHGVKFADDPAFKETNGKGRELHAQDFVTEFKRLALPSIQSQGWWIFDGKLKGINAFHDKLINT